MLCKLLTKEHMAFEIKSHGWDSHGITHSPEMSVRAAAVWV